MKLIYCFLFVCLVSIACQSREENLVGKYHSIQYSYFKRPLETFSIRNDFLAVGTTLVLNNDSSFTQTTCGAITTGYWHTRADSLYLEVGETKYKVDSVQEVRQNDPKSQAPQKPVVFSIKKNELHQHSIIYDSDSNEVIAHHNLVKESH